MAKSGALRQIPIERVYEPGNPTSHFNPLTDSLKIYGVLFRHVFVVFLATIVEFALYASLLLLGSSVLLALIVSRAISTIVLFWFAKDFVFKASGNTMKQAVLYLGLVCLNLFLLWLLIIGLNNLFGISAYLGMVLGYCLLFAFNFLTQRFVIFQRKSE